MTSNPFFFLSIVMSSFFAFFTIAFIIEISIKILRIKQHRVRSLLKLLPFVSLIIDLFFNQYSIAYWMNPLSCASCMQKIFLEIFSPQLKNHLIQNQISLMQYLGTPHQHFIFSAIFTLVSATSLFLVIRKLIQSFSLMRALHSIAKRAHLSHRPMQNMQLMHKLQKSHVKVYFSNDIQIPVAVYPNVIIIPEHTLKILSQDELEAVIAHEWEHIKYKDPLSRILSHLVAVFFWWIPTHFWIKKMEEAQEMACDQNVLKYGIKADSIASALFKVTRQAKVLQAFCYFSNTQNSTLTRIQAILDPSKANHYPLFRMNFVGVFFGGFLLLMCFMYL